jgi:hypothetical protein
MVESLRNALSGFLTYIPQLIGRTEGGTTLGGEYRPSARPLRRDE